MILDKLLLHQAGSSLLSFGLKANIRLTGMRFLAAVAPALFFAPSAGRWESTGMRLQGVLVLSLIYSGGQ